MSHGFVESPWPSGEDGATITAASAASMIPAARVMPVPVPMLDDVGKWISILLGGRISTAGASPGTFTIDVKYGSTTIFTFTSPTMAVSQTNLTYRATLDLFAHVVGGSAQVLGIGAFSCPGLVASNPVLMMPATAPALGTAFDARASGNLDINWTFSATGNSQTNHIYRPFWQT